MKRTLSLLLAVFFVLSALCVFAGAEETTAADPASDEPKVATAIFGTPVIDGDKDPEWTKAQINKVELVFVNDELTEPCVAQFRVMYDEFYLYFYVEVLDRTMPPMEEGLAWEMNASNNWYNKDGVAFCFAPDGDTSVTSSQIAPAFWFIIRAFGSAANYNQVPQNVFVTEDAEAVIADQNDFEKHPMENRMYAISYTKDESGMLTGYTIECKVNLKARYEAFKAEAGTKIGFEMNINNNNYLLISNGRNYGLVWNDPTVMAYKDNSLKGVIVLGDKKTTFVNSEADETLTLPGEETEPETQAPETKAPETQAPETKAPETNAPETQAPETNTPETQAPETKAPETEKKEEKGGCGSFAAVGAAFVLLIGTACVIKKK